MNITIRLPPVNAMHAWTANLIQSKIACRRTERIDAFPAGFFILENVRRTGSPVLHDQQYRPPYMSGSVELIIQTIHLLTRRALLQLWGRGLPPARKVLTFSWKLAPRSLFLSNFTCSSKPLWTTVCPNTLFNIIYIMRICG